MLPEEKKEAKAEEDARALAKALKVPRPKQEEKAPEQKETRS